MSTANVPATTTTTSPLAATTTTPTAPALDPIPANAYRRLVTVSFLSPTTGYGLFVAQTDGTPPRTQLLPPPCELAIARTTDGGSTFGTLVAVTACNGWTTDVTAAGIAFDDHGDGFLYGTSLFVTHDGGTTWQADPQAGPVARVEALGYSVWMVLAPCATGTCPAQLLESADGGVTWEPSPTPLPTTHGVHVGNRYPGARGAPQLVRTSVQAAYVLTEPATPAATHPATLSLWSTSDGGAMWTANEVPCGLVTGAGLSVAPSGKLFVVCAGEPGVGMQQKQILVSTDGGDDWTSTADCVPGTTCSLSAGYVGTLVAVSDTTAYIGGDRNGVVQTTDGGATWAYVVGVPRGGGTRDLTFFSASAGLVLVEGFPGTMIEHTDDGGETWTPAVS